MEELSALVWAERDLWETLLFRVHVEEHLGLGGGAGWRLRAAADVEEVLTALRHKEAAREAARRALAEELELMPSAGLREIGLRVGEPWTTIMADHVDALEDSRRRLLALTGHGTPETPSTAELWNALRGLAVLAREVGQPASTAPDAAEPTGAVPLARSETRATPAADVIDFSRWRMTSS